MTATAEPEIWVKPTNWCRMGPWPQANCEHVLSHFHADCNLCRKSPTCPHCAEKACGRVHNTTRIWGATPEQVRQRMAVHIDEEHPPATAQDEGRLF